MKSARGFTLVELLVVISVIGAMAALILLNFGNQTAKARDVERKSDTRQYQAALESYANRSSGLYPVRASSPVNATTLCASTVLNLNSCPDDPSGGTRHYRYVSDSAGTKYVLWAYLEAKPTNDVFVACSNGIVGEMTGTAFSGASSTVNSGNCPI